MCQPNITTRLTLFFFTLVLGELSYANSQLKMAQTLYQAQSYTAAISEARRALRGRITVQERFTAHRLIGLAYYQKELYRKALPSLHSAHRLAKTLKKPPLLGSILIDLGNWHERQKDHPLALHYYQLAIDALTRHADRTLTRHALFQMGDIYVATARYELGIKTYQHALHFAHAAKEPSAVTEALDYIGFAYRKLGDYDNALQHHSEALDQAKYILDPVQNTTSLARSYNHAGIVLHGMAHQASAKMDLVSAQRLLNQAITQALQALNHTRSVTNKVRVGYVLRTLSLFYIDLAEIASAPDKHAALEKAEFYGKMAVTNSGEHAEWRGLAQHVLARAYARRGKYAEADKLLSQAISAWQKSGDLYALGWAQRLLAHEIAEPQNQLKKSEHHYEQAIKAYQKIHAYDELSQTYLLLGRLHEKQGQLNSAKEAYTQAVETLEKIRAGLQHAANKQSFLGARVTVYESLISVLWKLWRREGRALDLELAFLTSERARGRTLLELLGRTSIDSVDGRGSRRDGSRERADKDVGPGLQAQHGMRSDEAGGRAMQGAIAEVQGNPSLAAQEQKLLAKQDALHNRLRRSRTPVELRTRQAQWRTAERQLEKFRNSLKRKDPAYAYLRNPQPMDSRVLRQQILTKNQALVEYFIGEKESFVFVLRADRPLLMAPLNTTHTQLSAQVRLLYSPFEQVKEQKTLKPLYAFNSVLAQRLYRVLVEPIRAHLGGIDEIIVVPHGALFYLPLEMLVVAPGKSNDLPLRFGEYSSARFVLTELPPLRYALSASLLNPLLRRRDFAPSERVAAFIYPQWGRTSTAVKANDSTADQREFIGLSRIYADRLTVYRQQLAKKSRLMAEGHRFGTLVLSTHGFFNEAKPLHSGILLAGESGSEAIVTVEEIFKLKINAKLVSLGVCEVGRGRIQDGEGLMGFTRAWHYAGAQQLMVTLWNVEHDSTSELSIDFHAHLTTHSATVALHKAKIAVLRSSFQYGKEQTSRAHPFFWAPFVLYAM